MALQQDQNIKQEITPQQKQTIKQHIPDKPKVTSETNFSTGNILLKEIMQLRNKGALATECRKMRGGAKEKNYAIHN